jgi:hypothetical protein
MEAQESTIALEVEAVVAQALEAFDGMVRHGQYFCYVFDFQYNFKITTTLPPE